MVVGVVKEKYSVEISRCPISGKIVSEYWRNAEGGLHRPDGPAVIETDRITGVVTEEQYYLNGEIHRPDGEPAMINYCHKTGNVLRKAWLENDILVRSGGLPTMEYFDGHTQKLVRAEYQISRGGSCKSRLHRLDGPAVITFDPVSGKQTGALFYKNGRKASSPLGSTFGR